MKTTLLAIVMLSVASSASAQVPAATTAATPQCVGECPVKDVDWIFYRYGTDCYGMDWRFLHAVAKAESNLDPKNHTGKYVGLFQMDTEGCSENLGPAKTFLSCSDLEDPEVNTAVSANRFNRLFTGKPYFSAKSNYPGILVVCPNVTAAEAGALAYIGHNNGPAVLKYVLKKQACTDAEIKTAITGFYENNPGSRDDGKRLRGKDLVDCHNKKDIEGKLSFRCVDAAWGIRKYEYGKKKISSQLKNLTGIYLPGAKTTAQCPLKSGARVYTPEEIKTSLDTGAFK